MANSRYIVFFFTEIALKQVVQLSRRFKIHLNLLSCVRVTFKRSNITFAEDIVTYDNKVAVFSKSLEIGNFVPLGDILALF